MGIARIKGGARAKGAEDPYAFGKIVSYGHGDELTMPHDRVRIYFGHSSEYAEIAVGEDGTIELRTAGQADGILVQPICHNVIEVRRFDSLAGVRPRRRRNPRK